MLPLVPLALSILSGGLAAAGIGTGANALHNNQKAQSINQSSQATVDYANESADAARKKSNKSLETLGKTKLEVLDQSMNRFISTFEKIHSIDLKDSPALNEFKSFSLDKQSIVHIRKLSNLASSALGGLIGGAGAGALAAFGAYSATMTFAAASTGTAIASLSGVAATNATLAFLGGGALAAGGGGMALGSTVLGGVVAGPAIAILGIVMNASASKNLDHAYSNHYKAEEIIAAMHVIKALCDAITARAELYTVLLKNLDLIFVNLIEDIEHITYVHGYDYASYTNEEQSTIAMTLSMAGAIKKILDTPLLDEDGSLTESSHAVHDEIKTYCEKSAKKIGLSTSTTVATEKWKPQPEYIRDIGEFLNRSESCGKKKEEFSDSELNKILAAFKVSSDERTADMVGLYDGDPVDCLTGKYSGILFMKEQLYYKTNKDTFSTPIHYRNIKYAQDKFSKMLISLRAGTPVIFKGIMYSTEDLAQLLNRIAEFFENAEKNASDNTKSDNPNTTVNRDGLGKAFPLLFDADNRASQENTTQD